jgi:hypothetical protein
VTHRATLLTVNNKKVLLTSKPAAPLPSTRNVSEYARCDNVDSTIEKKTSRTYRAAPDLCPHCRRTFVTDAFVCHARVCASVFGAKHETFNARESFLSALYCKHGVVNSASNKVGASAKAARSGWDFRLQRAALLEGVRTRRRGVAPRDGGDELLVHWPGVEAYPARNPDRHSTMFAGPAPASHGRTLVSALRTLVFGRRSVDVVVAAAAAQEDSGVVTRTSGGAAASVGVSGCNADSSAPPVPPAYRRAALAPVAALKSCVTASYTGTDSCTGATEGARDDTSAASRIPADGGPPDQRSVLRQ